MATQELVRDTLPSGVTLEDMEEHRLKDLIRPERIFQLVAPGLPTKFPPLKTLDSRPNNLPLQRNPLIGREKELEEVESMLMRSDAGLLTLTAQEAQARRASACRSGQTCWTTFLMAYGLWNLHL